MTGMSNTAWTVCRAARARPMPNVDRVMQVYNSSVASTVEVDGQHKLPSLLFQA
jgi:hypothetical protein